MLPASGPSLVPANTHRPGQPGSSSSGPVSAPKRSRSAKPVRLYAQDQTGKEGAAASEEKFIYPGDVLEEVRLRQSQSINACELGKDATK